jgi:hypothetical protein
MSKNASLTLIERASERPALSMKGLWAKPGQGFALSRPLTVFFDHQLSTLTHPPLLVKKELHSMLIFLCAGCFFAND